MALKACCIYRYLRNLPFRCITANATRGISVFSTSDPNGNNDAWQKAVLQAEKIVGFPTSFLSLRALLSDEFGGLAIHLRKLVGTKHPLLNTARGIVFDSKNYLQTSGLIVLLMSKATRDIAGTEMSESSQSEIYKKQHTLAEITELIHIAFLVHRGLVDIDKISHEMNAMKTDLENGNKMAVLGGDFLLANACTALAQLQNTLVVDLMSSSIEDMSTALTLLPETGMPVHEEMFENIPEQEKEWLYLFNLAHGSLLSNACHAAMVLCDGTEEIRESAKKMAFHLATAQQAQHDILQMQSIKSMQKQQNFCILYSLPVVMLSQKNGGRDYLKKHLIHKEQIYSINFDSLHNTICNDSAIIKQCHGICSTHINLALQAIEHFPESEAKIGLSNIILSVQE